MVFRPRLFPAFLLGVFVVPLLLLGTSAAAPAGRESIGPNRTTASLAGIVVSNGAAVANAVVTDLATGENVLTDSRGRFVLSGLSEGPTTLSIFTEFGLQELPFQTSPSGRSRGIISIGGAPGGSSVVLLPISGRGHNEFKGPISSIDTAAGTLAINDARHGAVTLTTNGSTVIRHGNAVLTLSNLTVGTNVDAKTSTQSGDILVAKEVDVEDDQAETEETELSGTIKMLNDPDFVLTTDSGDVTIHTDSSTVFVEKGQTKTFNDMAVGDDAEADGILQGDGSLNASKVSFEPPETEEVEVQGTVKSVNAPTFVVTTDSGDVSVVTDVNTTFKKDGDPASFTDVVQGVQVEAEGALQNDGSVLASKVTIESGDNGGGDNGSGSGDSGSGGGGSGDNGGND